MCVHAKSLQLCPTLCDSGLQPFRLLCPWNSLAKNTGVGYHSLLQGIVLNQGSNPCLLCLLHWQAGSLPVAPLGKPKDGIVYYFNLETYCTLGYTLTIKVLQRLYCFTTHLFLARKKQGDGKKKGKITEVGNENRMDSIL